MKDNKKRKHSKNERREIVLTDTVSYTTLKYSQQLLQCLHSMEQKHSQ